MADSVSTLTILNTPHKLVMKFTNFSDATGENAVTKVALSNYTGPTMAPRNTQAPSSVIIERIEFAITNADGVTASSKSPSVTINAAGTTPVRLAILSGQGFNDFRRAAGLNSVNTGTGAGNITFTTNDFVAGSAYDITLYMRKVGG